MTKKGVRLLFIMLSSLMLAVVMVACAKQEPTGRGDRRYSAGGSERG